MKLDVIKLDGGTAGSVDLGEDIFGLEPRADILHRVVRWQRNKARPERTRSRPGRKPAIPARRSIARRAPAAHATATATRRSFARGASTRARPRAATRMTLPKKVRQLGLKHALSAKAQAGELVVIEDAASDGKTRTLARQVRDLGWKRALVIDGAQVNADFARAARNIDGVDVLPSVGANVYDILKRDTLVLTKAAVEALEARLK